MRFVYAEGRGGCGLRSCRAQVSAPASRGWRRTLTTFKTGITIRRSRPDLLAETYTSDTASTVITCVYHTTLDKPEDSSEAAATVAASPRISEGPGPHLNGSLAPVQRKGLGQSDTRMETRYHSRDVGRRAVDGGIRIAGGPLRERRQEQDGGGGSDLESGVGSFLPPAYSFD